MGEDVAHYLDGIEVGAALGGVHRKVSSLAIVFLATVKVSTCEGALDGRTGKLTRLPGPSR